MSSDSKRGKKKKIRRRSLDTTRKGNKSVAKETPSQSRVTPSTTTATSTTTTTTITTTTTAATITATITTTSTSIVHQNSSLSKTDVSKSETKAKPISPQLKVEATSPKQECISAEVSLKVESVGNSNAARKKLPLIKPENITSCEKEVLPRKTEGISLKPESSGHEVETCQPKSGVMLLKAEPATPKIEPQSALDIAKPEEKVLSTPIGASNGSSQLTMSRVPIRSTRACKGGTESPSSSELNPPAEVDHKTDFNVNKPLASTSESSSAPQIVSKTSEKIETKIKKGSDNREESSSEVTPPLLPPPPPPPAIVTSTSSSGKN